MNSKHHSKPNRRTDHLSLELNDVLYTDAILIDGLTLTACGRDNSFQLDYSQYMKVIKDSYHDLLLQDIKLAKYLSLSQYTYYCIILLWKRLKYVVTARGTGVNEFYALERILPPMLIPEKISYYLRGIGNITDYNGRKCYLSIQASPNENAILGIPGHYGKVDNLSHINYETLPSPYVAVLCIMYDLAYTHSKHKIPENWDLPNELKPNGDLIINENLLGWSTAAPLSANQLDICLGAGLSAKVQLVDGVLVPSFDTSGVENIFGLPVIYSLLHSISILLSQPTIKTYGETTSFSGSLAVSGFTVALNGSNDTTPIYEKGCIGYTTFRANAYIASAILSFRYRVKRFDNYFTKSLCYTGHQGEPPQGWLDTANLIFDTFPLWNSKDFTI